VALREIDDDPIVRAIRRTPALRREDNTALARTVAQGGIEAGRARDRMIEGNMRLVLILARKYPDGSLTLHDRLQEGACGLMRAVTKFDPERGISFATYATFWVRAYIERAINANEHTITVPGNVASAMRRLRRVEATTPRHLTDEETEEVMHLSCTIAAAVRMLPTRMVPLDAPVSFGDDSTLVIDTIRDDTSEDPVDKMAMGDVWRALERCEGVLDRDKTMVGLFAFGETYSDIGEAYNLSRERVRQIIISVMVKLRGALTR
jgi:RNA polymerase primary sigma factor